MTLVAKLRTAASELSARGLTDLEIGAALGIGSAEVRRFLAAGDAEAASLHARAWRRSMVVNRLLDRSRTG